MAAHIKRAGLSYSVESVLSFKTQSDFVAAKFDEVNWINEGKRKDFLASIYKEAQSHAKKAAKKADPEPVSPVDNVNLG